MTQDKLDIIADSTDNLSLKKSIQLKKDCLNNDNIVLK